AMFQLPFSNDAETKSDWKNVVVRSDDMSNQNSVTDADDANVMEKIVNSGNIRLFPGEVKAVPFFAKLARMEPETIKVDLPDLTITQSRTTTLPVSAFTDDEKMHALAVRLANTTPGADDGDTENLLLKDVKNVSALTPQEALTAKHMRRRFDY